MANYWAAKEWSITLITLAGETVQDFYPLDQRIRRIRLGLAGDTKNPFQKISRNAARIWRLRQEIRRTSPEAVISFMDVNNVLTLLATTGLGLNVIVSERIDPVANPNIGMPWRLLRGLLYRTAKTVVGQTERVSQWLRKVCRANAVTIPNPLRQLPVPEAKREKLVLSVGRLDPQKGFDTLLRSFAQIHSQFPDWRLTILGEGPKRAELSQLAETLGISSVVDMPGNVHDPEEWMARAGLVVQASRFEGFPNVVMEAMAMEACVIATDCRSGPSDLIRDGDNGRLTPVDDILALADAMRELLGSEEERRRLGQKAALIRGDLAQEIIMSRWEGILPSH